jgi:hypothetical protein
MAAGMDEEEGMRTGGSRATAMDRPARNGARRSRTTARGRKR